MTVRFRQLATHFAAEVSPIDLRQVHDRDTLEQLPAGMDRYAVLVFRPQPFNGAEQLALPALLPGRL